MTDKSKTSGQSRRDFLKGAAAAGGAVAVVAATGSHAMATPEVDMAEKKATSSGYRETQHIRDYYRSLEK